MVGGSYEMDALSFDSQRSINLCAIISESGTSKSPSALRSTAGTIGFATAGGGAIRGSIESSGRAFFVSGDEFYEVTQDGTEILHGDLDTAVGRTYLAENPTQVMIIDDQFGYIFNKATDTFTKITSINFPVPTSLSFQDGYFIVTEANSSKFYISSINDGLTWGALDFTTVEGSPDYLVAIKSDKSNLWAFGTKSVEIYQNTGALAFPFQKISGAFIETGLAAAGTIQTLNNTLYWLGSDENGDDVVWAADGYNAVRVSTQAMELKISQGRNIEESYSWVYHERGHAFYMLQIKGLNTTLCLDVSTGLWHERVYRNPDTAAYEQHRGSCHIFAFGKHLVGDRETNQIYDMSLNYYSDNGDPLIKRRIFPYISDQKNIISHSSLEIDMEVGVGLVSGQGSDPKIMMRYSDNGRTWSSELTRSIGKMGKYGTRVKWSKLGRSRERVYDVSVSDPVLVQFNQAIINGA